MGFAFHGFILHLFKRIEAYRPLADGSIHQSTQPTEMAIYRCGRVALPLQIEAIILKELNRKSRQEDILLTATAYKRVKQSIGVPIVSIRPRTTAFSLGFEFFRTKSRQGRLSFPDILQIVLQQLVTHCSILVQLPKISGAKNVAENDLLANI